MAFKGTNDIKLLVNDEHSLYIPYSPETEFNQGLKNYIKSKIAAAGIKNKVKLTVLSGVSIDEEKFRTASANWIQDERKTLIQENRHTKRLLVGLLVMASLFIIISMILRKNNDVFSYTIIPVLGSVALGRAAGLCIIDLPTNKVKLELIKDIEKNNSIVFERIDSEPENHFITNNPEDDESDV